MVLHTGVMKINENGMQDEEKELIRNLGVERDMSNSIRLAPLLQTLIDMEVISRDTIVSYRSNLEGTFVFLGKVPLSEEFNIPPNDLEPNHRLTLKCRPPQ